MMEAKALGAVASSSPWMMVTGTVIVPRRSSTWKVSVARASFLYRSMPPLAIISMTHLLVSWSALL